MKKFISTLLVVCIICTFSLTLFACDGSTGDNSDGKKTAIIFTHGIGQGCLYNADNDTPFYCIPSLDAEGMKNIAAMTADLKVTLNTLKLNEDGTSNVNLRGTTFEDPEGQYFMLSMAKPICDALTAKYGDRYEVMTWGYDWRLDNRTAAEQLEKFINSKGYEKVIFVAHSMGGNIIADYLSRSQANRDKCRMFIPVGSPFFGSSDTYYFMYSGIFPNLNDIMTGSEFESMVAPFGDLNTLVESVGITPILIDVISNCPSLYQIFPSRAFFEDPYRPEDVDTAFCYNGDYYDYDDTYYFFSEEYEYSMTSDGQAKLGLRDMDNYQQSNYVTVDGKAVHVTTLVNTQYIVGIDCNTPFAINVKKTKDGVQVSPVNYTYGDAIVSAYSASAGTALDAENVHLFSGRTHLTIITDPEVIQTIVDLVGTIQ